ncbi:capsid protein [Human gut-associated brisavirus VW]|uniref:Capsid protein n=1 Tax=Human gut-associated brisavirus VW TaxID=2571073 RepID=A0A4D6K4A2_9VIRU|nr:capsid protein [Human gut-associated brisavirus VW]
MAKRYASRKRVYRRKTRKPIKRFRRYRVKARSTAKRYYRLKRAARNYSKVKKIRRAKRQYKTISGKGVKNKLAKLSISEFIQLPYYDLIRLASMVCSKVTPTGYSLTEQDMQQFYNIYKRDFLYKLGAILPEKLFTASNPFVVGSDNALPPYLFGFNPILTPVTCGQKMQIYASLYSKFKYVGIKVSWHPRNKAVSTYVPAEFKVKYDGDPVALAALLPNPASPLVPSTIAQGNAMYTPKDRLNQTIELTKSEANVSGNYYMHVYFGKQIESSETWDLPYFRWRESGGQKQVSLQHQKGKTDNKGRVKAALFYDPVTLLPCIESNSKLHKVYDMSKPFSFFVRPMVVDSSTVKEPNERGADNIETIDCNCQHESLTKGLKHLGYRSFDHALVPSTVEIPQDGQQLTDLTQDRWYYNSDDDNFFNPTMFWYCFTTSDAPFDESYSSPSPYQALAFSYYNTQIPSNTPNAKARAELSAHFGTYNDALNQYGYFDVTFYTKWKGERPLVSKSSYTGIVPSETGVTGLSTIISN